MNIYMGISDKEMNTDKIETRLDIRQNSTPGISRVYKRHAYGLFKKMIRSGRYTSVRMSARVVGVRPETIQSWLKSPIIQKILVEDIDSHIQAIERSKDWRAHAYLLEQLTDQVKNGVKNNTIITIVTPQGTTGPVSAPETYSDRL
jgi:hypothetical protein